MLFQEMEAKYAEGTNASNLVEAKDEIQNDINKILTLCFHEFWQRSWLISCTFSRQITRWLIYDKSDLFSDVSLPAMGVPHLSHRGLRDLQIDSDI